VLDATPKVIVDLRSDSAVAALVGTDAHGIIRVRGFEPQGYPDATESDEQPAGSFRNFVVVVTLATPRDKRLPIQRPRFAIRCYGSNPQQAMALYGACSDAIHQTGARVYPNRLGVWDSFDDTGATQEKDPDTEQPYVTFVAEYAATTLAIA
jgi:hypothetical protein